MHASRGHTTGARSEIEGFGFSTDCPTLCWDPQVVDCAEDGPPRCQRCKAYVNPFTTFTDSGRTFQCNLCSHSNVTPDWYICALGHDGTRLDKYERPELCCGSVEFVATGEYMVRLSPSLPRWSLNPICCPLLSSPVLRIVRRAESTQVNP